MTKQSKPKVTAKNKSKDKSKNKVQAPLKKDIPANPVAIDQELALAVTDTLQVAQQKALFGVIAKIRESLDLDSILKSTAIEVRQLLNADRVGMYRFDENSEFACGEFVSESVLPQFKSALTAKISDHCFGENHAKYYQQGRIWACADIYEQGLPTCHIQILERFQVRGNLVVPLLSGDRLWGLLCIHQCSAPRKWLESEIDFVKQIATHLDVALQQAEFVAKLQTQSDYLARAVEQAVEREKAVAVVINKIRRSLDLNTIFTTTTDEVRQLLQADRVTIYRFNPDWSGEFITESMLTDMPSLMEAQEQYPEFKASISECSLKCLADLTSTDTHLQATEGREFSPSRVFRVCEDIYATGFSSCYIEALERYQARAYAIVAIFKGKELWGIMAAYQQTETRKWQESEINFLIQISTQLGTAIQQAELFGYAQQYSNDLRTTLEIELQKRADRLARDAEQERALARVIERIRQTLDIDTIFKATTQEVRQNLNCDRVVVYRFFNDWSGEFIYESKNDEWLSLEELGERNKIWEDTHLQETQGGRYLNHESFTVDDIYNANLTECHVGILESYQVRAFMISPVFVADKLWGLLAAYQNSGSRDWEASEIRLLTQVGNQLGVALQQAELLVQLQKAKENADTANKAKSDFLAHMSHELRTPLNAILGFAQVLSRGEPLTQQQIEHVSIITRSGEHLLTLLNDVLEMSKIEAGMIELNAKTCNFHILLARLKDMFMLKAQAKNLQLIFEKAVDVPKYIHADESKLRQILINIIGNAIKFTEKGIVSLKVAYKDGNDNLEMNGYSHLFFEVADTGSGIAAEELDILFEPFVQTATGRRSQEGTGLGMAISKRFVKLMGGDIRVESIVGEGTVVKFDIEVQMARPSDLPIPLNREKIALTGDLSTYRILLVDDKYESRFLMKKLLAPIGFEIREAVNGQEAIEIWRSWQPHLIWMDMQMPVMDGYEATRIIRASESPESSCKIIALTASVFDTQRSAMLALGCDDFVSKPIREEVIFDKIAEHLGIVYSYIESETEDVDSSPELLDLQQTIQQDLHSLDTSWLLELHLATRAADEESIFLLLSQIQDSHPALATLIEDLVNNFHLDQIINLIQPVIDKNNES
ncbi:GAF domain-containing protein [Pseudanabaena sp. FACHB-1998]|uniref:GAF domain-containing protein n=1 Tax=Pseudanabaena sp. FACHB-1998 TaxID=2692858 RepID=UPI001680DCD6|nr:GAF domain-containing protein [Pseudanabaena sp. FACHB-1998]MBD2176765.1 GAF domain-containing protein [Pseudanabaena sp. FACHB-1998]